MSKNYYSALDKVDTSIEYKPLSRYENNGSVALVWDIEKGYLPDEFNNVDVIYAEPAWQHGYNKFMANAGQTSTSYDSYSLAIGKAIFAAKKPTAMIVSHAMLKYLPQPDHLLPSKINGAKCRAVFWGITPDFDTTSHISIMNALANKYDTVGDFCCGYGNTAKIFLEHGKKFVMSDINPRCIGYIGDYCENL